MAIKNYVLDTSVLLHDPSSLLRFEDNHVWIPVETLEELDRFKTEQTERGANARSVNRRLHDFFQGRRDAMQEGAVTPDGGRISVLINGYHEPVNGAENPALARMKEFFPNPEKMDHRILACCLHVQATRHQPTILVSKDINMQLKALALGLESDDYLHDKVEDRAAVHPGLPVVKIGIHQMQRFASAGSLVVDRKNDPARAMNEYVLLESSAGKTMPARCLHDGTLKKLCVPAALGIPGGIQLRGANLGQLCFLDALLDPEVSLVTCLGPAGTGKTLLAIGAGLFLLRQRLHDGLTISRPVIPMGDTLGFLPGDLKEKMRPWLQPIYDALECLMPRNAAPPGFEGRPQRRHRERPPFAESGPGPGAFKPHEKLIAQGVLEVEALCYIRGRSIPNRFFVLDEAQQLTPLEAKTIVTRMSKGSKLIMVGDPDQIDHPYVDARSNGLVYARNRMRCHPIARHVTLSKGERSALAEAGASAM
ncbi:MAG: PhoH family protein [Verrucomicrobiae bacterium]|nr:PhoH family protein [Verrucomicrobiae bacterium]